MSGRLAKRYARALLDLAREADALEPWGAELTRAAAAFSEPRLQPILLSPAIDGAVRRRTARAVADALALPTAVRNLIHVLAEGDRLAVLPDIARWYEQLLDDAVGRARVTIRSAVALAAPEKTALIELARRLTKSREVLATSEVDPELLGGVVLDVGGTVYDGSVRSQLARLGKEMAEDGA
jgi:F-type H+-transporting ATPase subunit delta